MPWALRDSNPRPPPCKSGRGVSEGAGQRIETPADQRERVSVAPAMYPCVAVRHGLQTDLKPTATVRSSSDLDKIKSPLPSPFLLRSLYLSSHVGFAILDRYIQRSAKRTHGHTAGIPADRRARGA